MTTSIESTNLCKRIKNCLRSDGIKTLEQLAERRESEVWRIRNFGKVAMAEIKAVLSQQGLSLKKE